MLWGATGVKAVSKYVDEIDPWYLYAYRGQRVAKKRNFIKV